MSKKANKPVISKGAKKKVSKDNNKIEE